MDEFLKQYGIIPNNIKIYEVAMSHSSYANEHKDKKNYERLEFLGDAVLELVVSEYLYKNYEQDEGNMTKTRANYVCEEANFEYMNKLGLIKYIKVGNGEVSDIKKAIVADIFEAFIGAIYLDQGFPKAKEFVLEVVTPYIINKTNFFNDYKSILQEAVQTDRRSLVYELIDESGPAHDKSFTIAVKIDDVIYGKGKAGSKKEACQLAAKASLEKLARKYDE
jgi:ribonuclease-3